MGAQTLLAVLTLNSDVKEEMSSRGTTAKKYVEMVLDTQALSGTMSTKISVMMEIRGQGMGVMKTAF